MYVYIIYVYTANKSVCFFLQTWCVNGNCFSLQKEHETAIKFLQRAIQVDPTFAYAYTLLGHEYTLTEDYDKAMSAFRSALRVDTRHYNAWYVRFTAHPKEFYLYLSLLASYMSWLCDLCNRLTTLVYKAVGICTFKNLTSNLFTLLCDLFF